MTSRRVKALEVENRKELSEEKEMQSKARM
jgi:hypothetical protein